MKRIQIGLSLLGFSLFAILLLRFVRVPFVNSNGYISGTSAFIVLGLVFLYFIKLFKLPSLTHFGPPRFTAVSILALVFAASLAFSAITHEENELKPWKVAIPGILFLLSIGFGEEIVARGFLYGVLKERSHKAAILVSSLLFGLMHLNLYTGSNWDPWLAYWHIASAFCFGFLMCAFMVATQSIWVPILAHALFDWSVVFDKTPPVGKDVPPISYPFWEGVASPFMEFIFIFTPGLIIFFFMKRRRIWAPLWFKALALRLAVHWKLVDETEDKSELVGQY